MAITSLDRYVFIRRTDGTALLPMASPVNDHGANSTSTTVVDVTPGFTMRFDGASYTTVGVSVHGYLRLAGTIASATNSNLFAATTDVVLAPWWDSMRTAPTGGYVQHEVMGAAPFRKLVIEWYCALNADSSTTNRRWAKFQAVLFESKDRVEYRYGIQATAGTPSGASGASIGVKGVTTVVTDNFRDLSIDNLELGGSRTTTTTNLNPATQWPTTRIAFEPNWPMCGFYVDAPGEEVTGIVDPESDYHWRIANNVNWLYCNHRPPLVNLSPWAGQTAGTGSGPTVDDPVYVAPVSPSLDDGDDYTLHVEAYSTDSSVTMSVERDDAVDPQPDDPFDWDVIASDAQAPVSDIVTWSIPVAVFASVDFLRFAFTGDDVRVMSIVLVPPARTDIDPDGAYLSGFVPMAIGQVRRSGAAIHPEFFNRAWKNCARILADRKQVLWSFGTPSDAASAFEFSTSGNLQVRTIGKAPATMGPADPGGLWPAQDVTLQVVAKDSSDGGALIFAEDGAASTTFTVDDVSGEYRYQEAAATMLSSFPTIALTADPLGAMRVLYAGIQWTPNLSDEDYIQGVTPPARLAYLDALSARVRKACLYSYAMTGLATMLRLNTGVQWHCQWMIPPATKALQPKLTRHDGASKTGTDSSSLATEMYATTSGAASDDEIRIPPAHATGRDRYPPDGGTIKTISGALVYETAPADPMDRLLESPTAGTTTGPVLELVRVIRGVGMTLIPRPDATS
jgi:hypothetical protein